MADTQTEQPKSSPCLSFFIWILETLALNTIPNNAIILEKKFQHIAVKQTDRSKWNFCMKPFLFVNGILASVQPLYILLLGKRILFLHLTILYFLMFPSLWLDMQLLKPNRRKDWTCKFQKCCIVYLMHMPNCQVWQFYRARSQQYQKQ